MDFKKKWWLVCSMCLLILQLQAQSKKEFAQLQKIYTATLEDQFRDSPKKPFAIVLGKATHNEYILTMTPAHYIENAMWESEELKKDSSWIAFFRETERKKRGLRNFIIPTVERLEKIVIIPTTKDSIKATGGFDGKYYSTYGFNRGYVELSDAIFSDQKDKAIVEVNWHQARNAGMGTIVLLQKNKKQEWKVQGSVAGWIE